MKPVAKVEMYVQKDPPKMHRWDISLCISFHMWAVVSLIIWRNSLHETTEENASVVNTLINCFKPLLVCLQWKLNLSVVIVRSNEKHSSWWQKFSTWELSESYICCVSQFGQESSLSRLCHHKTIPLKLALFIDSISLCSLVILFQSNSFF